jgi:aquaporin Z
MSGSMLAPIAIGATLMVMVYMGGHISGAHYNPAVSLAILIRGKMTPSEFGGYVVSQIVAAFVAAWVAMSLTGGSFAPAPGPDVSPMAALTVEALYTFALALVVLNVAATKATSGNSYYGLAIGFTVGAGAIAGGGISGGAFNPAVGIGPNLANMLLHDASISHVWLYIVGPCVGGSLAALVHQFQNPQG